MLNAHAWLGQNNAIGPCPAARAPCRLEGVGLQPEVSQFLTVGSVCMLGCRYRVIRPATHNMWSKRTLASTYRNSYVYDPPTPSRSAQSPFVEHRRMG